jgi:RHH-type transcriptional regulator, rel operon repressor / antitoxin RelB
MGTLAIRLPDEMHERLNRLAQETARPKAYYIKAALEEYLDDIEEVYLAEATLERIKRGEERVLSAEEFWRGQDD